MFESGAAADRSSWALVQLRVARFARAIVYDRSGLGRSPVDPAGRTTDRMADDLGDLLDHFGPRPFILVGSSAGGPIIRLAASRRPERIAGLVLVDPSDEASDILLGKGFRTIEKISIPILIGLARLRMLKYMFGFLLNACPADVRADMEREAFEPRVFRTQRAQERTFLDEISAWRDNPLTLGEIPVTAISGGLTGDGMNAAARASANASHAHRAAQSPHGRHVVAEKSSHYVPITEPEIIVDEIERLGRNTPVRGFG
ncbi:alpha/beta fold hydrolase [Rhodococcus artemisiae]|uniref:Alpha/beta hydrolase n=1 Tax=Rhodococcus artemisiae TaxID=714159 RepID=A0ABU7LAN9_9NOCA|nr:alpha/beta hydrolase [Rhodococcus artemisiae]MEE2058611.1 alpha/beta hydrolase [Rhodococcus artemisiae]